MYIVMYMGTERRNIKTIILVPVFYLKKKGEQVNILLCCTLVPPRGY
jgi:hypothetical protein